MKAVFPVAGLGTRFLPATKANPKEMLAIVDKPLIQYAVEEAVAAGITDLIFVTNRNKRSIADHFDRCYELEYELQKHNKAEMLNVVQNIIPPHVNCIYVMQAEPLGLGHAVLCSRAVVGDEPFVVLLADDLINNGDNGVLRQMLTVFEQYDHSVLAVENVATDKVEQYGIVAFDEVDEHLGRINDVVEKPDVGKAPSTRAIVGRYVFTPAIFDFLEQVNVDSRGEIQLTDAIAALLKKEPVYSYLFAGKRYDCGSKAEYLQAVVEYALQHPDLKEDFLAFLRSQVL